jgi:hypothetical protein
MPEYLTGLPAILQGKIDRLQDELRLYDHPGAEDIRQGKSDQLEALRHQLETECSVKRVVVLGKR